ncbi:hypothetical protein PP187_gp296 [Klebsiella phage vB_KvM-Eowyn]|uniref:Uncharacterized protein n=1 Tax=Klebsiella phage vB_KvM-Eowyn TaxID=2762819 RepID=A0A7R8MN02_9CAUD|nr:hypothetical protein PP187_gp296 [Klebsiella phage vB_KvM-Eowyn]CAD5236285.1 hypothetical protein LLCLJKAH_00296 [Klebsiella phage vB_KvM-Eowyn]
MSNQNYFPWMQSKVAKLYPVLTAKQVRHICNIITNYLRSFKGDIWGVDVANMPFNQNDPGYFSYHEVLGCEVVVFIRITVD